jgi:hypothetical protein
MPLVDACQSSYLTKWRNEKKKKRKTLKLIWQKEKPSPKTAHVLSISFNPNLRG